MTLPGHDAADGDESCGAEAEFLCAQQGSDHHIAGELQATIHTQSYSGAEACQHQRSMCVPQSDFPGQSGVLDGGERRCSCAAIVTADGNDVRSSFGHSGGDNSHSGARNQLDPDARIRVYGAQVVDQLRQVFDAVDVMVWRRRNQRGSRHSVPQARDVRRNLCGRQLAAFPGLRALRHLDLDFIGMHQVFGSDAKSCRCHLLHAIVRLRAFVINTWIFTALARVAASSYAVHGDRQSLVSFG